jgi:L-ascorbate metabolism protein UlaG (beta-lactamase superfamily)
LQIQGSGAMGAPNQPKGDNVNTKITYLGGPTYLIEIGNFRLLTDPGFDPEGTERSEGPGHSLKKVMSPPIAAEDIGRIDAVLLSHQQHYDNLDNTGRAMLPQWGRVLTTPESAAQLDGLAEALDTWESVELTNDAGESIRVTATPAVHAKIPEIQEATGDTTGFLLEWDAQESGAFWITGDTVYYEGLEEVAERFDIAAAILHLGSANVPAVGDHALTMDGDEGARITRKLDAKQVFPAHFEGWLHFREGGEGIAEAFARAGLSDRLVLAPLGEAIDVAV